MGDFPDGVLNNSLCCPAGMLSCGKGRLTRGPMPGCDMHIRRKLAEKARNSSLLKIK